MSIDLAAILKALEEIMSLEKKIETAIQSEKDLKRRARLLKAIQERDIDAIKEILYSVS
jgi:uncharacterized protein YjaG (DUF416 family)